MGRENTVDTLMTVHEVAKIFRVDDTTVRRWVKAGTFPAVELPHVRKRTQYRIRRSDIERILGNERT